MEGNIKKKTLEITLTINSTVITNKSKTITDPTYILIPFYNNFTKVVTHIQPSIRIFENMQFD